ncbi:adhesion G-protein coupled receptor G5-like isoform X2 [Triplophysa rosa]|uniref:adhesion G-protein coupled receptor G5-like isoform X2 n=1 Tax=Triplophysa rosa TaxID=992332 RepID=UPI0025462651|nr:adhesion G-protein coupled receptor G5-like isoform X2 [Triplophysa rosa]
MKQNQNTIRTFMIICLVFILGQATTENDKDFKMCGIWRHGNASRNLTYDLRPGCEDIRILGNEFTLSIQGSITAKCKQSATITLDSSPFQNQSNFCVFWEPLLDLLIVEVNGRNRTLCGPNGLQGNCCTNLSPDYQNGSKLYGIVNGSIKGDPISSNVMEIYTFRGESINCKKKFCDEASENPGGPNMIEEAVMKSSKIGRVDLPCVQGTIIEMEEGFTGHNITLPAPRSNQSNTIPSIYLPPCLKSEVRKKSKVVLTYFRERTAKTFFKQKKSPKSPESTLLDDIVGISVENEIITNLPEPVRIRFRHSALPSNFSNECVSWDTRKDKDVMWRSDGCETFNINAEETECCCKHLTYFAILVQVKQRATVRHLKALTFITAVGCAVSLVSCLVLFYWLCKKRKGKKNQSSLVHRGLVVAIFLLSLFFILTGTMANVGNETVCQITGTLLHYALLSALCWMAVEVFHAFLLVHQVFEIPPPSWLFYLGGFGLPALLVVILVSIGDIYGQRKIVPSDDVNNPYYMCWMLDNEKSRLVHYIVNMGLLVVVMSSGMVMLFYVVRKIMKMQVLKNRYGVFLSIWGITCLFGTTWGLSFLDFGPFSEATLFLFCIINSLQGFFLMLRHFIMKRIEKTHESSGSSSGSSKQLMLQTHEKS